MKKFILAAGLVLSCTLGLQQAALAGFTEGATAYNNKQYSVALKEVTPLAKAGNADAQHLLGLMYYMGRGVEQDYQKAFQWHRKAAEQGKADAQYVVGAMYYTGNTVIQDHKQAVVWFRKAAEQGHADSLQIMGLMYRYHMGGVEQDNVIAYMLWNVAAARGSATAVEQRAAVARQLSKEQIEEGQALSAAWKPGKKLPRQSRTGAN